MTDTQRYASGHRRRWTFRPQRGAPDGEGRRGLSALRRGDRLGGRILTVDDTGAPSDDGFDLGPSWIWPRVQPALAALIRELGLETFGQTSVGDVVFDACRANRLSALQSRRESRSRCVKFGEPRHS
jgi:hypothetical protein